MTTQQAIAELMAKYNECRAKWVERDGDAFSEEDFHAWFTAQVAKTA